jgi:hypothetical protein
MSDTFAIFSSSGIVMSDSTSVGLAPGKAEDTATKGMFTSGWISFGIDVYENIPAIIKPIATSQATGLWLMKKLQKEDFIFSKFF